MTTSTFPIALQLPNRNLEHPERLDWLRLIRSERVGPITFFQLLDQFGSAADALEALPELAQRGGRAKKLKICSAAEAEGEIEACEHAGARLVAFGEADYPPLLTNIADPPPVVTIKGDSSLLAKPSVAVVGARNASAAGVRLTKQIAQDVGHHGMVVVSGMARGIDTSAHWGALESGTIAVLGGGIDVIYPAENKNLYKRIAEDGLIVAETPVGTQPTARHFPRRNRLISGMCHAVLVVEAAPRSGSLITARLALEQGREVLAVPGSPLDPRSRGTNNLIRSGALLCESAEDVATAVRPMLRTPLEEPRPTPLSGPPPVQIDESELVEAREIVTKKLGPTPVEVDELLRQTQLTPAVLFSILLELELAGHLERHAGNKVSAG